MHCHRNSRNSEKAWLRVSERFLLPIAIAATLGGCGGGPAPPVTFTLTDLGTLGGAESVACSINEGGKVVGYSLVKGNAAVHGFLWDGKSLVELGEIPGTSSCSYGINDAGQVVGVAKFGDDKMGHAALWTGDAPIDLGQNGQFSDANAINASGQVAGNIFVGYIIHAVRWDNLKMTDLGTLGGRQSTAQGINEGGVVVGFAELTGESGTHAVIWKGTEAKDLGTLGGQDSFGMAINKTGQVAGYAGLVADSAFHATLWTEGKPVDLGTLGGNGSMGLGLNDSGLVVGSSDLKGGGSLATLWIGQNAYDLNSGLDGTGRGWTLVEARGINAAGQIVGWGKSPSGQSHGFLLTPSKPIPLKLE